MPAIIIRIIEAVVISVAGTVAAGVTSSLMEKS